MQAASPSPVPQGVKLDVGGAGVISRQQSTLLRSDIGRAAAQTAGTVQRGPNSGQRFLRVFSGAAGFRHNRPPKLGSRPEHPRFPRVFIILGKHVLLTNDRTLGFVPVYRLTV